MLPQGYEEAIRHLKDPGIEIFSTVSAIKTDIVAVEARLGVTTLPSSYPAILPQFGMMSVEGIEVYGSDAERGKWQRRTECRFRDRVRPAAPV